ncbi:MAG: hypothetical protein MI861_22275, partial [Pirellulales bacterium]|nr:hypothetical protein [Pirellulales bacterium]
IAEGSTDRLTLESLTGDVAVLDWGPPGEIVERLARLGFEGVRAPHGADPEAPQPASAARRIYAFDLNTFQQAGALCEAVVRLKTIRQTRTFSLSLGRDDKPVPRPTPPTSPQVLSQPASAASQKSPTTPSDGDSVQPPSPHLDLDDLIDKLDDLDP